MCIHAHCLFLLLREEIVCVHANCLFFISKGGDSVKSCSLSVNHREEIVCSDAYHLFVNHGLMKTL